MTSNKPVSVWFAQSKTLDFSLFRYSSKQERSRPGSARSAPWRGLELEPPNDLEDAGLIGALRNAKAVRADGIQVGRRRPRKIYAVDDIGALDARRESASAFFPKPGQKHLLVQGAIDPQVSRSLEHVVSLVAIDGVDPV